MSANDSISFQICVGVTGHRKLPNPALVEDTVRKAIESEINRSRIYLVDALSVSQVQTHQPVVPTVHLHALSPLAEGADRLVARIILSYPGAELNVVLPLMLEDYLQDFESEESRLEFEELLHLCKSPVILRRQLIRQESSSLNM